MERGRNIQTVCKGGVREGTNGICSVGLAACGSRTKNPGTGLEKFVIWRDDEKRKKEKAEKGRLLESQGRRGL